MIKLNTTKLSKIQCVALANIFKALTFDVGLVGIISSSVNPLSNFLVKKDTQVSKEDLRFADLHISEIIHWYHPYKPYNYTQNNVKYKNADIAKICFTLKGIKIKTLKSLIDRNFLYVTPLYIEDTYFYRDYEARISMYFKIAVTEHIFDILENTNICDFLLSNNEESINLGCVLLNQQLKYIKSIECTVNSLQKFVKSQKFESSFLEKGRANIRECFSYYDGNLVNLLCLNDYLDFKEVISYFFESSEEFKNELNFILKPYEIEMLYAKFGLDEDWSNIG